MEHLAPEDYEREPWPDGWDDVVDESQTDEAVIDVDGEDVPF